MAKKITINRKGRRNKEEKIWRQRGEMKPHVAAAQEKWKVSANSNVPPTASAVQCSAAAERIVKGKERNINF